jgi:WhiB family redox-sensing transcriptional regulator
MLASLPWTQPPADSVGLTPPKWVESATCGDLSVEEADGIFFPQRGQSGARAGEVCRRCSDRVECLEQALSEPEEFGIWGGASERAPAATPEGGLMRRSSEMAKAPTSHAKGLGPPVACPRIVPVTAVNHGTSWQQTDSRISARHPRKCRRRS